MQILSDLLQVLHVGPATNTQTCNHFFIHWEAVELPCSIFFSVIYKPLNEDEVLSGFKKTFLPKILLLNTFYCQGDSHKHGAQFEEVIVIGVLHFNNSPGVETTTDLLPLHLNQLVGANHSKGNARLGGEDKGSRRPERNN